MLVKRRGISAIVAIVIVIIIAGGPGAAIYVVTLNSGSGNTTSGTTSTTHSTTTPTSTHSTTVMTGTTSTTQSTTASTTPTTTATSTVGTTTASTTSTTQGSTVTSTTYSCGTTTVNGSAVPTDYTNDNIALVKAYSNIEVRFVGTYNGTQDNITMGYNVISNVGGIYTLNFTLIDQSTGFSNATYQAVVNGNNNTVMSVTAYYSGYNYTFTGDSAKGLFNGFMAGTTVEVIYNALLPVFTDPAYFKSSSLGAQTLGSVTFQVTEWTALNIPEVVTYCGSSSTLNAFVLDVGTASGISTPFITYLHVNSTSQVNGSQETDDFVFQLVSITQA